MGQSIRKFTFKLGVLFTYNATSQAKSICDPMTYNQKLYTHQSAYFILISIYTS